MTASFRLESLLRVALVSWQEVEAAVRGADAPERSCPRVEGQQYVRDRSVARRRLPRGDDRLLAVTAPSARRVQRPETLRSRHYANSPPRSCKSPKPPCSSPSSL